MINQKFYEPSLFEYLDVIGLKFTFKVDGKENYRTNFGAFLSILYLFLLIGLFFVFGIDLYQRKNPKVSYNNKIVPHEEIYLSNHNFTLAFRVEDYLAKMIVNESIFHHELAYYKFVLKENGEWENVLGQLPTIQRCQDLNSTKGTEEFYNISLASWYCIDFNNLIMGGNWDGDFVYGLLINTKQCQFSKNSKCLKEQELKSIFQNEITGSNFYYSLMYLEALPDMDDFDRPIKQYFNYKFESLSLKVQKRRLQYFKRVIIKNDKGWFFNDLEEKEYLSSDTIVSDFNFKDELNEDVVYSHYIYFANKVDIYNRSYIKIQEVIANIGGFSKILYAILTYIYLLFGKYLKNIYLIKRIEFDIKDELGILNYNRTIKLKNWSEIKKQLSSVNHYSNNNTITNNNYNNIKIDTSQQNRNIEKSSENNINTELNTRLYLNNVNTSKKLINSNVNNKIINKINFDYNCSEIINNSGKKRKLRRYLVSDQQAGSSNNLENIDELKIKKSVLFGNKEDQMIKFTNKIIDNSNLQYLNHEQKSESKLNINKGNEIKSNLRELYKNNTIFSKGKTKFYINLEEEKNNISILKLIFSKFAKLKKGSTRNQLAYYYYYYFTNYSEEIFNIFNYFKICNEIKNIKDILFEEHTKQFSDIRPVIELDDSEFGSEYARKAINAYQLNNKNKSYNNKIDRIFTNLLEKLDKKEL